MCLQCLHPHSSPSRVRNSSSSASLAMFGRIGGQALRCAARRPGPTRKVCGRRFSAHTGANAASTTTPSPLGAITVELDRIAPRFEIPASQITILDSPANFYSTLKVRNSPCSTTLSSRLTSIFAAQNPQCQAARLPVDTLHWQDRVRTHRDLVPCAAR